MYFVYFSRGIHANDSYLMVFCGKGKCDCLYFNSSRFIIPCRFKFRYCWILQIPNNASFPSN